MTLFTEINVQIKGSAKLKMRHKREKWRGYSHLTGVKKNVNELTVIVKYESNVLDRNISLIPQFSHNRK